MKLYTICYMVTGGITVEAETMDDALERFQDGEFDEEIGRSLAENEVSFTQIYEEEAEIRDALFVSIWDGVEIDTPCKVNMDTKEVFDIVMSNYDGNCLEGEYIEIGRDQFPVFKRSDIVDESNEFWYDG